MNKEELRENLITIGLCDDNKWLDDYIALIWINKDNIHKKYETHKHHIIPQAFYNYKHIPIDNSDENTVYLTALDHAKAHVYLSLCSKEQKLKNANACASWLIAGHPNQGRILKTDEEINEFFKYLETIDFRNLIDFSKSEATKEKLGNLRWCNNGEEERHYYEGEKIPDGYVKGRLQADYFKKPKNRIWINNGKEQHCILPEEIDNYPGFKRGMLDRGEEWRSKAGKYNRDEVYREKQRISHKRWAQEHPNFRNSGMFKKGQEPSNKGKIWITNGFDNLYIDKDSIEEWECRGFWKGNTQFKSIYLKKLEFTTPIEVFNYYKNHTIEETSDFFNVKPSVIYGYLKHFNLKKS